MTAVCRSANWPKRPAWPPARSACGSLATGSRRPREEQADIAATAPMTSRASVSCWPIANAACRWRRRSSVRSRGRRPLEVRYSIVREFQPSLQPLRLPLWAMLALSRAIEDECFARAGRPVLAGSFQTERAYRIAEHRWREIARTAALSFVLADFGRRTDASWRAARDPGRRPTCPSGANGPWSAWTRTTPRACRVGAPADSGRHGASRRSGPPRRSRPMRMRTAIGLAGPAVAERGADALAEIAGSAPPAADASQASRIA